MVTGYKIQNKVYQKGKLSNKNWNSEYFLYFICRRPAVEIGLILHILNYRRTSFGLWDGTPTVLWDDEVAFVRMVD